MSKNYKQNSYEKRKCKQQQYDSNLVWQVTLLRSVCCVTQYRLHTNLDFTSDGTSIYLTTKIYQLYSLNVAV